MTDTGLTHAASVNTGDTSNDTEPPTDGSQPAATTSSLEKPSTVRALKILVIVLGVILIAGFATVIGRIAYLVMRPAPTAPATNAAPLAGIPQGHNATTNASSATTQGLPAAIDLPGGAVIDTMALDGNRLAVSYHVTATEAGNSNKRGIIIVDLATGQTIRSFLLPNGARKPRSGG